jgi:hypothetical protein
MKVPFMSEPRAVSAALRTNVADAARGRKAPGNAGVMSSSARAASSSRLDSAHQRLGSSSYLCPPSAPAARVANDPTPSFRTHFRRRGQG